MVDILELEPPADDPELDPEVVGTDIVPTHPDDPSPVEDDPTVAHDAPQED